MAAKTKYQSLLKTIPVIGALVSIVAIAVVWVWRLRR